MNYCDVIKKAATDDSTASNRPSSYNHPPPMRSKFGRILAALLKRTEATRTKNHTKHEFWQANENFAKQFESTSLEKKWQSQPLELCAWLSAEVVSGRPSCWSMWRSWLMVHGISSKAAFRLVKMKIRALVQSNCLFYSKHGSCSCRPSSLFVCA